MEGVGVDVAIGGDTRDWRNGRDDGGPGMGWDGMDKGMILLHER